jgi:uncharacterized membrane protein
MPYHHSRARQITLGDGVELMVTNQDAETVKTVLSASATLLGLQLVFVGIFVNTARDKIQAWGVVTKRTILMAGAWLAIIIVGIATIVFGVWFMTGQAELYGWVLGLFVAQLIAGTLLVVLTAGLVIFSD